MFKSLFLISENVEEKPSTSNDEEMNNNDEEKTVPEKHTPT